MIFYEHGPPLLGRGPRTRGGMFIGILLITMNVKTKKSIFETSGGKPNIRIVIEVKVPGRKDTDKRNHLNE